MDNTWNQPPQKTVSPHHSRQQTHYQEPIVQQPIPQEIEDEDGEDISEILSRLKVKYEVATGNICLLCKRSLGTTEKLVAHFQVSKLHAENLVKAAEEYLVSSVSLPVSLFFKIRLFKCILTIIF